MCGRFSLTRSPRALAAFLGSSYHTRITDGAPRYNVAPGQLVLGVRNDGSHELVQLHWGLIPAWARNPDAVRRPINARAETIATSSIFRGLFARRRALVFADGFYEWRVADGAGGRKTPYYLRMRDGSPFAFAALWDRTHGEVPIESTALVTTAPNLLVAPLHDRMPVILPRDAYEAWLDPRVGDSLWLLELLVPYDATAMEAYPVSLRVNWPANDTPDIIEPLAS
jgi:putative SOS response-associated peptidase YedK